MGLIDMHCHVLPGIDDGSKNMEMSVNMVRIASEEGIDTMILTPHFHPGKGNQDISIWKVTLERLRESVSKAGIDMKFYLGSELYYSNDIADYLESGRAISMVDSDYVLVEFMPETEYRYIKSNVREIQSVGKRPIVAHIERYECLYNKVDRIEELIDMGAYIQVNADTVTGGMGFMVKQYIKKLLKKNYIDFIGTDAHRDVNRAPKMADCYNYVCKKYGEEYANRIMHDNALKIINNQEI